MAELFKHSIFALLVFVAMVVLGLWLSQSDDHQMAPVRSQSAQIQPVRWTSVDENMQTAAYEGMEVTAEPPFDPEKAASGKDPSESEVSVSDQHLSQVRRTILRYFPQLPPETVAGWVDTYKNMPAEELSVLLEQKTQLSSLMPSSSYLSKVPDDIRLEFNPTEKPVRPALEYVLRVTRQNLLYSQTPGHRCRRSSLLPASTDSSSDLEDDVVANVVNDLRPSTIIASDNPLHMAIHGHPERMFRMEPGCVLTRNGCFERLDDGRLGSRIGDRVLVLAGNLLIPDTTSRLVIDDKGMLQGLTSEGKSSAVGQLELAEISDVTLVTSNGVYFTIASSGLEKPDGRSSDPTNGRIKMVTATEVTTASLETSNVNQVEEWQLYDHFKRLQ